VLVRVPQTHQAVATGMMRLIEGFNRQSGNVYAQISKERRNTTQPEVFVQGSLGPGPQGYRLDVFSGYEEVAGALLPRFRAPDITLAGDPIQVSLPFAWVTRCMAVNRGVKGIGEEEYPRTWKESRQWADMGNRMEELEGGTFVIFHRADVIARYLPFYWAASGTPKLYDSVKRVLCIDATALARWFRFFGDLVSAAVFHQESPGMTPFLSGRYLFYMLEGPWLMPQSVAQNPDLRYSLHPLPAADPGGECPAELAFFRLGIDAKGLSEKEKSACWSVINYLLSEEAQSQINDLMGLLPVVQSLWDGRHRGGTLDVFEKQLFSSRVLPGDIVNKRLRGALALEFFDFLRNDHNTERAVENFQRTAEATVALYANLSDGTESYV